MVYLGNITANQPEGGVPDNALFFDLDGTLRPMDPPSFMPYLQKINIQKLQDFKQFQRYLRPVFEELSVELNPADGFDSDEIDTIVIALEKALDRAGPSVKRLGVPLILQYLIDDFDPRKLAEAAATIQPFSGVDKLLENLLVDVGDYFIPSVITGSVVPYAIGFSFVLEVLSMGGELHARKTWPNDIVKNLFPTQMATLGHYEKDWKNPIIKRFIENHGIGSRKNDQHHAAYNGLTMDYLREDNKNVLYVCDAGLRDGKVHPTDLETLKYVRWELGGRVALVMDPKDASQIGLDVSKPMGMQFDMNKDNTSTIPLFVADYTRGTPLYTFIADSVNSIPDHRRIYQTAPYGLNAIDHLMKIEKRKH